MLLSDTFYTFVISRGTRGKLSEVGLEHVRIQRGRQGVRTPLKNHKNVGFLAKLVQILEKITKLPSQHSMLGYHRPASETPFKWRFAGGPMMALFKCYLDPLSSHQKTNKQTKIKQKKACQSWTPSGKTFWIRACRPRTYK